MSYQLPHSDRYQQANDWLLGRINYERTPGQPYGERVLKLDRMQLLAHRLGDPQSAYPIIHVAGTKGKGSTSAMLASMLSEAGYRVGVYSSPHLVDISERFVVDGSPISAEEIVDLVDTLRPVAESLDEESHARGEDGPTFFDIATAMAMLHFRIHAVDLAILEVGLGGRLDSTNIVQPAVSVITSISFDHTKQLGNTLSSIAREKAGIVKPGVPIVSGVATDEPREVIAEIARTRAARLWQVGRDFHFDYRCPKTAAQQDALDYRSAICEECKPLASAEYGLVGEHQAANAATALATVDELVRQGWRINDHARRTGLAKVRLAARVELLPGNRPVVVDTAHNPASATALVDALRSRWQTPWSLVLAVSKDKDVEKIVATLAPHFERIYATRFVENPRAVEPSKLAESCNRFTKGQVRAIEDPLRAFEVGLAETPTDQLVVISGSFFIAAELRDTATALISNRPLTPRVAPRLD